MYHIFALKKKEGRIKALHPSKKKIEGDFLWEFWFFEIESQGRELNQKKKKNSLATGKSGEFW